MHACRHSFKMEICVYLKLLHCIEIIEAMSIVYMNVHRLVIQSQGPFVGIYLVQF